MSEFKCATQDDNYMYNREKFFKKEWLDVIQKDMIICSTGYSENDIYDWIIGVDPAKEKEDEMNNELKCGCEIEGLDEIFYNTKDYHLIKKHIREEDIIAIMVGIYKDDLLAIATEREEKELEK